MAIEGPLKELGIHDVFQLLDVSRKTGVLRITSKIRHNQGTVYFDGGAVVIAGTVIAGWPEREPRRRTAAVAEPALLAEAARA